MKKWVSGISIVAILGLAVAAARGTPLTELPLWIGCGVAVFGGTWYGTKKL